MTEPSFFSSQTKTQIDENSSEFLSDVLMPSFSSTFIQWDLLNLLTILVFVFLKGVKCLSILTGFQPWQAEQSQTEKF